MNKINLPKVEFIKGAMEYPLCTDLLIAHLLVRKGMHYADFFSDCLEMEVNSNGSMIEEVLKFPTYGENKYNCALKLIKTQKVNDESAIAFIQSQIARNEPAVVHFDSYYCPWDMFYGKRHNDHVLFVTGISKNGNVCRICDPYFGLRDKKIKTKQLLQGMRFYFSVTYTGERSVKTHTDYADQIDKFANKFREFINLLGERMELLKPETDNAFVSKLYLTLQKGRINLYFYRLFLLKQGEEKLSAKLYEADCLWTNCLLYHIRGARSYYEPQEMLRRLQTLSRFLSSISNAKTLKIAETFTSSARSKHIPLAHFMNCKMFVRDDEGEKSDFIENEKLSITLKPNLSTIEFQGRKFRLFPNEEKDNIRCAGQKIMVPDSGKGISLLFVAEWIDATVSLEFMWEDGSKTQYQVTVPDFPKKGEKSVDVGEAYDLARWKSFNNVYANVVDIVFETGKRLRAFRLPEYSHLHLLSAVVIE